MTNILQKYSKNDISKAINVNISYIEKYIELTSNKDFLLKLIDLNLKSINKILQEQEQARAEALQNNTLVNVEEFLEKYKTIDSLIKELYNQVLFYTKCDVVASCVIENSFKNLKMQVKSLAAEERAFLLLQQEKQEQQKQENK